MSTPDPVTMLSVGNEFNITLVILMMFVGWTFGQQYTKTVIKFSFTTYGNIPSFTYKLGQSLYIEVILISWFKAGILVLFPLLTLSFFGSVHVTFYNPEVPIAIVFVFVGVVLSAKPTNSWLTKNGVVTALGVRRNSIRRASAALMPMPDRKAEAEAEEGKEAKFDLVKYLISFFANVLIFLTYPFTVITLFRSLGVGGRMAIVLFFHPLIMEYLMHGFRAASGRSINFLGEETDIDPIKDMDGVFILESYLVLVRRIMLCNLGSTQATIIAIIITGIEETAVRSTIEQRDIWYRKFYLNKLPQG